MHFARQGIDPHNDYLCSLVRPFRDGRETTSEQSTSIVPTKAIRVQATTEMQEKEDLP